MMGEPAVRGQGVRGQIEGKWSKQETTEATEITEEDRRDGGESSREPP